MKLMVVFRVFPWRHLPYHESDHVANIAYNILCRRFFTPVFPGRYHLPDGCEKYHGKWGYAPLVVSLEKTREPLYIINRSGNCSSHLDSAQWVDKALDLMGSTLLLYLWHGCQGKFEKTGRFLKNNPATLKPEPANALKLKSMLRHADL
jgi:hypothetical protein